MTAKGIVAKVEIGVWIGVVIGIDKAIKTFQGLVADIQSQQAGAEPPSEEQPFPNHITIRSPIIRTIIHTIINRRLINP
jgi:hypothetical protein